MSRNQPRRPVTTSVWQRLLPAALAIVATVAVGAMTVSETYAKSPGARYCYHGFCHRVGTLAQTETLLGWRGYLQTSYYDSCRRDRLNPCGLTSSGAVFRPDLPDNAASPLLPDGTVILAYYPKSGGASVLRINNAGPYSGKRKLDVSRAAATKLGFRKRGGGSARCRRPAGTNEARGDLPPSACLSKSSRLPRPVQDFRRRAEGSPHPP